MQGFFGLLYYAPLFSDMAIYPRKAWKHLEPPSLSNYPANPKPFGAAPCGGCFDSEHCQLEPLHRKFIWMSSLWIIGTLQGFNLDGLV